MKPLPLPVRIAAGLVVTAAEQACKFPQRLVSLPVTVASQALQLSMRLQQHVTELAIKGDEVLSSLRPTTDQPNWATFDETNTEATEYDLAEGPATATTASDSPAEAPPKATAETATKAAAPAETKPAAKETNGDEGHRAIGETNGSAMRAKTSKPAPAALPGYDELSLPQLRARLRRLSLAQLEELLSYERSHAGRASFVGMLSRRIATVRSQG